MNEQRKESDKDAQTTQEIPATKLAELRSLSSIPPPKHPTEREFRDQDQTEPTEAT